MTTDRIDRATGATTEYPLPRQTSMRRLFVEDSTSPPSLWVGSTHGASILHIEPLDQYPKESFPMSLGLRQLRLWGAVTGLPLLLAACVDQYGYGPPGTYAEPASGYYYAPGYYPPPAPGILLEERLRDDRYREERLREERLREERLRAERAREEDRRHAEERRVENRPPAAAPQRAPQPQARQEQRNQPQAREQQRNQPHSASDCGQRYGAADCKR